MLDLYKSCNLCPKNCGVNRLAGEIGFCGETGELRIGSAVIHKGEEPPLVGTGGSGTIFVTGCNLGCVFCQNYQLSKGGQAGLGKAVSADGFAEICSLLQGKGAENINIVTGSHAVPALVEGFDAARKAGVEIPILWNSSGYESTQTLEILKDYIDIYLPDLKTLDSNVAQKYFNAPDYPETAKAAILKMIDILKEKMLNEKPLNGARGKIIIRHLVLPGLLESTRSVLRWFSENIKEHVLLSLMTQYTPIPNRNAEMPDRFLSEEEYKIVLEWLEEFEIDDGFCQELVTGSDWLPDFKLNNPFSSELSVPVWHFSTSRI